jgi:hypothetical protein
VPITSILDVSGLLILGILEEWNVGIMGALEAD